MAGGSTIGIKAGNSDLDGNQRPRLALKDGKYRRCLSSTPPIRAVATILAAMGSTSVAAISAVAVVSIILSMAVPSECVLSAMST